MTPLQITEEGTLDCIVYKKKVLYEISRILLVHFYKCCNLIGWTTIQSAIRMWRAGGLLLNRTFKYKWKKISTFLDDSC